MHMQLKILGDQRAENGICPGCLTTHLSIRLLELPKPIVNVIRCVGNVSGSCSTAKLSGLATHGVHELAYQVVAS